MFSSRSVGFCTLLCADIGYSQYTNKRIHLEMQALDSTMNPVRTRSLILSLYTFNHFTATEKEKGKIVRSPP